MKGGREERSKKNERNKGWIKEREEKGKKREGGWEEGRKKEGVIEGEKKKEKGGRM